jgi:hypothetical protein
MKFFFLATLISFHALAQVKLANGNGVGNGGDAVVCKDSAELLDFAEAKLLKKFTLISSVKSENYMSAAKERLEKLKGLDRKLADQYLNVLLKVDTRWKIIENAQFRDVPDSFEIAIPDGCKLEQLAIQQEMEGKTVIHVSKKIWDRLNVMNKAGLLLHEIIYEHFITTGETNSVKARKFNAFLFSQELEKSDKKKYREVVRSLGIKAY